MNYRYLSAGFIAAIVLTLGHPPCQGESEVIEVSAGPRPRRFAIASFPADASTRKLALRGDDGSVRPLQYSEGLAWFVETNLPAGSSRRYRITQTRGRTEPSSTAPSIVNDAGVLELRIGARPVLRYLANAGTLPRPEIPAIYRRGGYIHPFLTPSGRPVTDDYPPNHIHHHGIWSAWTKTRFEGRTPDFWNMGDGKGRVDFLALDYTFHGPVFAGFRARQIYRDSTTTPPVDVLEESWVVRLFNLRLPSDKAANIVDLECEHRILGNHPLELPKYLYGGIGYRGPWDWNGAEQARFLDSNGATNRIVANESRARWFWLGGQVDGKLAGIAFLGHPSNFRAPQPLRVHPKEPFVCWAPSQIGDWSIDPGSHYRARYRVVATDGEPEAALLDQLWDDYASPPPVRRLESSRVRR